MKLSVIVPVYNEGETIDIILKRIKTVKLPVKKEIVVVDDGSTDNTLKVLRSIKGIKIIHYGKNQGKGFAVRLGIKKSKGDIIIIQDADLEYDPKDYPLLVKPILDGKSKIVYGSRFNQRIKHKYLSFYLGNLLITLFSNILYGCHLSDLETCYKCFKREVLGRVKLKENSFGFEPEFTAEVLKRGYRIFEIPIHYNPRSFEQGKKIKWSDGIKAMWILLKKRF